MIIKLCGSLITFCLAIFIANLPTNAINVVKNYVFYDFNSKAEGTVISSELIKGNSSTKGRGTTYEISYSYTVNDKVFISNVVNFTGNNSDTSREIYQRYPQGKKVTVLYDSDSPSYAILEKNAPDGMLWFQFFSILLIAFGSAYYAFSFLSEE